MKLNKAISNRILSLLFERDITIKRLSELSDISNSSLNNIIYETCKACNLSSIEKICNGFNISLCEFFSDKAFASDEQED